MPASAPVGGLPHGHGSYKYGAGGGGPPVAGHGGMVEPGYGVLATQQNELYNEDEDTVDIFPWHKGRRAAPGRHAADDDIWVSSSDPAERAWAIEVANHRA